MRDTIRRHAAVLAAATGLALAWTAHAAAQGADEDAAFDRWDRNDNGALSEWELKRGIGFVYEGWDYDGNDEIMDLEVARGVFDAWDIDGDEDIDMVEFRNGTDVWFPEEYEARYVDWDLDGDAELSYYETASGLWGADWYDPYDDDSDGMITRDELAEGLLATLDRDVSGAIERDEWPL